MTSPARKHFLRVRAAVDAAQSSPERPQGESHELHRIAIIEDSRRLHDIQSIERKIDAKREMLPKYDSYVQGVLEAGTGQQDDVLVTLMVWYLDIGDVKNRTGYRGIRDRARYANPGQVRTYYRNTGS